MLPISYLALEVSKVFIHVHPHLALPIQGLLMLSMYALELGGHELAHFIKLSHDSIHI